MTYPGGGKQVATDTAAKQPRKIDRPLQAFRPILRKIRRGR